MATLVALRAIEVGYERPILPPVDLSIASGEAIGIVGPNGSGKSTLVRTLLGLLPPLGGRLLSERRPRFGYVPQRATVDLGFPLTALEVTLMGRYGRIAPGRRPGESDLEATRAALRDVDALELAARPFHALSGGQRQRVLVARALAAEPEILVLDEPTTGMDLPSERALLDLVRSFTTRGLAVVLVSHQLGAVADHVDRLVLVAGHDQPVVIGSRAELVTSAGLSRIYGCPIAVRTVDGHSVIFVESER